MFVFVALLLAALGRIGVRAWAYTQAFLAFGALGSLSLAFGALPALGRIGVRAWAYTQALLAFGALGSLSLAFAALGCGDPLRRLNLLVLAGSGTCPARGPPSPLGCGGPLRRLSQLDLAGIGECPARVPPSPAPPTRLLRPDALRQEA